MAVNQLKTLFEQQNASGSSTLNETKSESLPRAPKNSTHASSRSPQPQPVNKHSCAQAEKTTSPGKSSPGICAFYNHKKDNSLPRCISDSAKLSSTNSSHMAYREGISGTLTQGHRQVRLNNSCSKPKSPDGKSSKVVNSNGGALQSFGSAESLTSSNDSDETRTGCNRLWKRTTSDEDLSSNMAAVGSESTSWRRAILKKSTAVIVDTEPPPQSPAEGTHYLLEAKKALRKTSTHIDIAASTSKPPLSLSPDGFRHSNLPVVRTSAASPNAPSGDEEYAVEEEKLEDDEVSELGSVGARTGKFESQVSTSSASLSEQPEEEWDEGSEVGLDDWVFLHKDRGSVDSSGLSCVKENGSPPDPEPPSERCDTKGTTHEGECSAHVTISVGPPDPAKLKKDRKRRQNIAQELLDTEKTYASRLELISVKFYEAVMQFNAANKQLLPETSMQQIFLNVPQIYALSQNILAELQKRMDNWSKHEQLGDVLCKLAPFLKLYSTYTAGFEGAMKTLTEWTSKDKKFDALVKNFDRELGTGLGITSYMLEPIQRIPRYRMLLTDYVKHLPEDSPERADSEKALGIISEAADRSNDRFKELERCNEILSIQRSLQDCEDTLLVPGRFFIRKGLLNKESSKKEASRHMFFLFSDIFLCCTVPQSTHSFKLKYMLKLEDMIIEDRKVAIIPHAFAVKYITKSFVLGGSCEEEKQEWMATLIVAMRENRKKNMSLRRESRIIRERNPKKLGCMAPIMVNDKSVSMCQLCKEPFTITFRRHHCRACGKVVCGNCLLTKVYLEYMKKEDKICNECWQQLNEDQKVKYTAPTPHDKHEGVLDVKGYEENAILATYVLLQEGKKWNKVWFQLKDDLVLYKFVAHEDVKAYDSKPLPGYTVFTDPATSQIRLVHTSKRKDLCETFKLDNQVDFDHWVEALQKAVQMEYLGTCISPVPPSPVEHHDAATI